MFVKKGPTLFINSSLPTSQVAGQALTRGLNAKPRPKNKAKAKAAPEKGSAEPAKSG